MACELDVNDTLTMGERSKSKKKKCKNRKNKRHDTEEDTETVAENIVYDKSKKKRKLECTGINNDVESEDVVLDKQGSSKKKKKKKKSKSTEGKERGSKEVLDNGEVEDVAESVDSGCIVDSNSDIISNLSDWPQVQSALLEENKFITNFLTWLPAKKVSFEESAGTSNKRQKEEESSRQNQIKGGVGFSDLDELQEKYSSTLANLKSTRKKKLWDPATRRKEAKLNKKLNRLKKRKTKRLQKNTKLEKLQFEAEVKENGYNQDSKPKKPIYNKKGQLVFSKFDFSNDSTTGDIDTNLKPKDLKQLLSQALKEKEKVKRMEQKGETEKAAGVIEQKAWSGALQKAEGLKVRNDVDLIKKSIKKKESSKKTSQKNWEERKQTIEKKKEEKQNARKKNIKARKETKLNKKMKKMKKKGHIVPGF
ncbi:surfeit locus protein 6 homolog [Procambarus clarkii]|uniref:surfeit locus protein 6 homolog n=1 Tax=Procambarus clarkii TaxID=6728 RepID=UPI001E677398|nr:surfeit locus protein 6 homolog [Procambarus clarkii]XP_045604693.1 surfeit locus protein 6 homolog [Procambarus clarkii]XP_045604694.1 surfeit locus protein 6 homolog [Procambarus clarkii]XP_045604695.1 surfeit locus protein 6 homolog [Procambarus clarkii]